jgi:hypothetical protein
LTLWGFDYSWARPNASFLKSNGCQFVCRYLSWLPNGKVIDKAEYDFLMSIGVAVVLNWEYYAEDMIRGANHYADGQTHAREAERQRKAMGAPAAPIYFSADFDAQPGHQAAINSYLDGVASVIGRARTGIYASYYTVERTLAAGKAMWAWQTYAWSYGNVSSRAHLYQYQNGVLGGSYDRCRSLKDDFGQITKSGVADGNSNSGGLSWMSDVDEFKSVINTDGTIQAPSRALAEQAATGKPVDQQNLSWSLASFLRLGYDWDRSNADAIAAARKDIADLKAALPASGGVAVDQASVQAAVEAGVAKALESVPALVQAAVEAAVEDVKATLTMQKGA